MATAADDDDNEVDSDGATGDYDSGGMTGDYDDVQRQLRQQWGWRWAAAMRATGDNG